MSEWNRKSRTGKRTHKERERERKGDATHCCCRRLQRIHVASPWRPFSPDHRDMPHSICASCFAWCATFPGRLPPVDTWMKRRVCVREGGSKRGRGILTCVNLPLAFSKSAWYFTFDWIFVFSAMRFSSGVSAIAVALALGMCLQGGKKQKKKKQMRRGKRARRWVRGKVQVAVGLRISMQHVVHVACCGILLLLLLLPENWLCNSCCSTHTSLPWGPTAHHWPQLMERMNSPSPCFSPLFSLSLLIVRKTSDPHLAVLSIKTAFLLSCWHFDTGCFSYWFPSPASSSIFPLKATNG